MQRSGKLRMKFDKGDRFFDKEQFEYVEDPTIEYVESGAASQDKVPKGIPAGGIKISVSGKNLAYIQSPEMYVIYENQKFTSVSPRSLISVKHLLNNILIQQPCVVLSNSNMACKSPSIEFEGKEPDLEPAKGLVYGFHMDNVTGVQNLSNQKGYSRFFLYPNPVYEPFDEEIKYYKSDYLTINVRLFKPLCKPD
jgi:plexin A